MVLLGLWDLLLRIYYTFTTFAEKERAGGFMPLTRYFLRVRRDAPGAVVIRGIYPN